MSEQSPLVSPDQSPSPHLSGDQAQIFKDRYIAARRLVRQALAQGNPPISESGNINLGDEDEAGLARDADNFVGEFGDYIARHQTKASAASPEQGAAEHDPDTLQAAPQLQADRPTRVTPAGDRQPSGRAIELDTKSNIFTQLEKDARDRGRPGMVGLEWRDQDGRLHRVSKHDVLERVVKEHAKQGVPILKKLRSAESGPVHYRPRSKRAKVEGFTKALAKKGIPIPVQQRGHIGGGPVFLERRQGYREKTGSVDYWTVDVFNNEGDLVNVMEFKGKHQFEEYFKVPARANPNAMGASKKVPRKISDVRWGRERQQPEIGAPAEAVAVPDSEPDNLFKVLATQQEELGLSNWQGLTWVDQDGNEKKVVRDTVVIRTDPIGRGQYPERVFEVRTRNKDGKVNHYHLYNGRALQEHFSLRPRHYPDAPKLNLHWEILKPVEVEGYEYDKMPADPLEQWYWKEERAWLGWTALFGANTPEKAQSGIAISMDEAYALLGHPGFAKDDSQSQTKHSGKKKRRPQAPDDVTRQALALQQSLAEVAKPQYEKVVKDFRESYLADLRKLGIEPSAAEQHDNNWAIEELAKQLHLGNPFEAGEIGQSLRRRALSARLGKRFQEAAIKDVKMRVKDWDRGAPEKQIERTIHQYIVDPEYNYPKKVRALMYHQEIDDLLKKRRTSDDPPLSHGELAQLGLMLRRSLSSK